MSQVTLITQHRIHVQQTYQVIHSLTLQVQASSTKLFRWFKNNHLKANPAKSHSLLSTNKLEIPRKSTRSYNRLATKV